jgi:hypothetical protein
MRRNVEAINQDIGDEEQGKFIQSHGRGLELFCWEDRKDLVW